MVELRPSALCPKEKRGRCMQVGAVRVTRGAFDVIPLAAVLQDRH